MAVLSHEELLNLISISQKEAVPHERKQRLLKVARVEAFLIELTLQSREAREKLRIGQLPGRLTLIARRRALQVALVAVGASLYAVLRFDELARRHEAAEGLVGA